MTSTRSALDADWLGVCRRAVAGLERGARRGADHRASGRSETGYARQRRRPHAGDRPARPSRSCSHELDALRDEGYRLRARSPRSAARSTTAIPSVRVIIDPIDGSLNAKRGIPHHALSIAVADGTTMADVAFGFVYDFGPREEWWARRGEGAWLQRRAARPRRSRAPRPRRPARGARDRVGRSALGRGVDRRARGQRLPAARARHDRLLAVPGRGRPVRRAWCRCAAPAASTPPPAS